MGGRDREEVAVSMATFWLIDPVFIIFRRLSRIKNNKGDVPICLMCQSSLPTLNTARNLLNSVHNNRILFLFAPYISSIQFSAL